MTLREGESSCFCTSGSTGAGSSETSVILPVSQVDEVSSWRHHTTNQCTQALVPSGTSPILSDNMGQCCCMKGQKRAVNETVSAGLLPTPQDSIAFIHQQPKAHDIVVSVSSTILLSS